MIKTYCFIFLSKGFLCPICRRKFADTTALEHHYLHAHSHTQPTTIHEDTNGISNSSKHAIADVRRQLKLKKTIFNIKPILGSCSRSSRMETTILCIRRKSDEM